MADELITVPAQVMGMNPRADRSWKLVFETSKELSGEDVKILADNFQGEGWLLFKPNSTGEISVKDVPETDADAGVESPSKRLRKRIYVLWEQKGKKGSFDNFYLATMSKFMEMVEEKLEPKEVK